MASSLPPRNEPSARDRVFAITELLEQILAHSYRPGKEADLLRITRVNKEFRDTIMKSPTICRILGFKQDPDSLEIDYCSCDMDPVHVNEATYTNTLVGELPPLQPFCVGGDRLFIYSHTLLGAPRCEFHHTRDEVTGQLVGVLEMFSSSSCGQDRNLKDVVPTSILFKGDLDWLRQSYRNLHLSKMAKTTIVTFPARDQWLFPGGLQDVTFKVQGATFGQILEIAHSLEQAARWHNLDRLFHGEHGVYDEVPGIKEKNELSWLCDVREWKTPFPGKYDTKMSWSWQHFVDDTSLVKLVLGAPTVTDAYSYGTNTSEMKDTNTQGQSHTNEDEEVEGLAPGLDWW